MSVAFDPFVQTSAPDPQPVYRELLGVPMEHRPTFRRRAEAVVHTKLASSEASETTTAALGNAAALLDRERWERECLLDDPSRNPGAVEEVLRYAVADAEPERVRSDTNRLFVRLPVVLA